MLVEAKNYYLITEGEMWVHLDSPCPVHLFSFVFKYIKMFFKTAFVFSEEENTTSNQKIGLILPFASFPGSTKVI